MRFTIYRPNIETKMSQKSWCIWSNIFTKYKCLELFFLYFRTKCIIRKYHMVSDTIYYTLCLL